MGLKVENVLEPSRNGPANFSGAVPLLFLLGEAEVASGATDGGALTRLENSKETAWNELLTPLCFQTYLP